MNKFLTLLSIGLIIILMINFKIAVPTVLYYITFSVIWGLIGLLIRKLFKRFKIKCKKLNLFLKSNMVPFMLTMLIMGYGLWNINNIVETNYKIETDKMIRNEGYRVALISDLHYEVSISPENLMKCCDMISDKNPDIVILCGDLVDENTSYNGMREAINILSSIKSKYGIFYVYGNHDANRQSKNRSFNKEQIEVQLKANNIISLIDETHNIEDDFVIIGRNDLSYKDTIGRKSGEELLEGVDMDKFLLLADHQPCEYVLNSECGYDLEVSGHTHGGQFFPISIACKILKINDLMYGYKKIDNFQAIVSSGIAGWGIPAKTESRCEYVIIDIN